MNDEGQLDPELLLAAVDAAQGATTLDEALLALVEVLHERLELSHAHLASITVGGESARILAAWSLTESAFAPGTVVLASIAAPVRALFDTVLAGDAAIVVLDRQGGSLVDHLLSAQGVSSAVSLPVQLDDGALLVLSLGSSSVGPIQALGPRFFRGLGAGLSRQLGRLVLS